MERLPISNEDVAAYHELISGQARKYNGFFGAEYDDLYQEGMLPVIEALGGGKFPSRNIIVRRIKAWVSRCARHWMGGYDEEELLS